MPRETVLGGPDLQTVLLDSKTHIPLPQDGAISRHRLIEGARASGARVVSVTAPAGYGKSTMLAEWASGESRSVAWVSLDRTDDDPASLLSAIATASSPLSPAAASVVADMRVGASALGRSAPLLAAALAAASTDFVLFIDDLHRASSSDCQDVLEVLLSRVPRGSQVVVASRSEAPLIARLRAAGEVWEVGVDDLSLGRDDARAIFDRAGAEGVADADLDGIVEKCEGWPTGLFLCALVARAGGDAASVTGDDRYLADYLYRECLERLPEDMRDFLRRSSVLEAMSPAACNAVLGIEDARSRLHEVETANLFLIPMDRNRGLFRYHALFRQFLLTDLERAEGAGAVAALHRRAAAWHEENGASAVAVEHLLQAGETEDAAELVAELSLPMYNIGRGNTVRRWLDELGEGVVRSHPPLVVAMVWSTVLFGDVPAAERWSAVLEAMDFSGHADQERVALESARAMVRVTLAANGMDRLTRDAEYALQHEPASSRWRDQAMHLWGVACVLRGDTVAARRAFAEAIELSAITGNVDNDILSEPELALLAIDEGDWAGAGTYSRRGLGAIEAGHMEGYPTTALALAVAARVAVHDGDREYGERLLSRAMVARVGCTYLMPWYSIRVRLNLAKAHVALGDRSAAWHLLREIDDLLHKRPDVGVLSDQVEDFRDSLRAQPSGGGSVPLTPAELRLLPYLQTHLTIAEIGQRLFISRNTVSSEVGSIYRKLGVTTRGAAVERAVSLGLLGG